MQVTNYGKVAVIMGGNTSEREISLLSGTAILQALHSSGVDACAFDPATSPLSKLQDLGVARAFLAVHGKNCEDGKLQGALEYLGIPYTGSGVMASSIGMDKYRTKLIWQAVGIPVAKSQFVEKDTYIASQFKLDLALPVVVKPADDGSTLGLSKVYSLEHLLPALELAFANSNKVLIEPLIIGPEFTATIINGQVYPLVKIEAPGADYDFEHKYYSDDTVYVCPYALDDRQAQVEELALRAYQSIGASGVARVDFMLSNSGDLYFLEINTLPGMTSHSLVPMAAKAKGINFAQLCILILDGASLGK